MVEDVEHERELDVLQDLGVDGVALLELEPDHLDGHVGRKAAHPHLLLVDRVAAERRGVLRHRLLQTLEGKTF